MATDDVGSERQSERKVDDYVEIDVAKEVDLVAYYEAAGRLVVDPK
jgi:phage anti-repressor protein